MVVLDVCDSWDIELVEPADEAVEIDYLCNLIYKVLHDIAFRNFDDKEVFNHAEIQGFLLFIKGKYTKSQIEKIYDWIALERPDKHKIFNRFSVDGFAVEGS